MFSLWGGALVWSLVHMIKYGATMFMPQSPNTNTDNTYLNI